MKNQIYNFKIQKISDDITEIDETIKTEPFDSAKAVQIIKKHNTTDINIAVINSPSQPNFVRFDDATPQMLINNLKMIKNVLCFEMADEIRKMVN